MDCYGCKVMDPWSQPGLLNQTQTLPAAALGMYAPMLEQWLRYFPSSAMRIYNYEQVVASPQAVVNEVLRFLGTYTSS